MTTEDSLDRRVSALERARQTNNPIDFSNVSIEEKEKLLKQIQEEQEALSQNSQPGSIDNKLGSAPENKKPGLGKIVKDLLKISPLGIAAYLYAGPAAFLSPLGLAIGGWIADKKKGIKTTWDRTRKRIGIGFPYAMVAYFMYSFPNAIGNATLGGKILRTLAFNPLAIMPFLAVYKPVQHLIMKYGTKEMAKSFFNFKIFKYMKEGYNESLKGKYWKDVKETFLTLGPINFLTLNYVNSIFARMSIGTFNDVLIARIAGDKGLLAGIKDKFKKNKSSNYKTPLEAQAEKDSPQPSPVPANAQYPTNNTPRGRANYG